jgi:hypothetical protein
MNARVRLILQLSFSILKVTAVIFSKTMSSRTMNPEFTRTLPSKLIVGYANWNQCDESIVDAVASGVNVVIWFSINLLTDSHGMRSVS